MFRLLSVRGKIIVKQVYFHPTLYWACHHLSMLGLKLTHVSKRAPWYETISPYQNRKRQAYIDVKGEYQCTLQNIMHYMRRENKVNKDKIFLSCETLRSIKMNVYAMLDFDVYGDSTLTAIFTNCETQQVIAREATKLATGWFLCCCFLFWQRNAPQSI